MPLAFEARVRPAHFTFQFWQRLSESSAHDPCALPMRCTSRCASTAKWHPRSQLNARNPPSEGRRIRRMGRCSTPRPRWRLRAMIFADSSRLDPQQLETSRTSTLDGHRSLRAVKVLGYERDEFLVRPALDGRCFHLRHPTAIRQLRERRSPCVGFHLDADAGETRAPVCRGQSAPWSAPPRAATGGVLGA
jgi:hypothetical protein